MELKPCLALWTGISGEVLISHMRNIDTLARPVVYAGAVPPSVLEEAPARLATLLGIEP